jgi:hypothetical protein
MTSTHGGDGARERSVGVEEFRETQNFEEVHRRAPKERQVQHVLRCKFQWFLSAHPGERVRGGPGRRNPSVRVSRARVSYRPRMSLDAAWRAARRAAVIFQLIVSETSSAEIRARNGRAPGAAGSQCSGYPSQCPFELDWLLDVGARPPRNRGQGACIPFVHVHYMKSDTEYWKSQEPS